MRRFRAVPSVDKKYFRRSADKTKLVNTGVVVPRGGIRL